MSQKLWGDILEVIATEKGVEPTELDFILADYIDPDAIEQLAAHDRASWTLTFELPEHEVTVTSDGTICASRLSGKMKT